MKKEFFTIQGSAGKPITADISYFANGIKKPVIIFCHGFKGFKDWGHFNLVAKEFAESGFVFVKFNFSHNGTTPEQPLDFADLDAFGQNNFSKELNDLGAVIDFVCGANPFTHEMNTQQLFLCGHSRGGGIVLMKSAEEKRIAKSVTWASIGETEKRMHPAQLEEWKTKGVVYVENARTKQSMPLCFQFHEDYVNNRNRQNLELVAEKITIPVLLMHGEADETVNLTEAQLLHRKIAGSELYIVQNGDHSFGGKHPYQEHRLPLQSMEVIPRMIAFLLK